MTIVSDVWTVSPGPCESCGSCEVTVDEITIDANTPSRWSKHRGNEWTSQEPLKMWWPVLCLHKPLVCAVAYYIQSSRHRVLELRSQEGWPHRWQCLSRTYGNMGYTKKTSPSSAVHACRCTGLRCSHSLSAERFCALEKSGTRFSEIVQFFKL